MHMILIFALSFITHVHLPKFTNCMFLSAVLTFSQLEKAVQYISRLSKADRDSTANE